jgi:hypothetical protein
MNSKSRVPVWVSMLASTAAAGLLVVAGCALDKKANRPEGVFNRIGGHGDGLMESRRCLLRVVILNRPLRDPAINEVVWRAADEQVVPPAERRALEANGLRVGRITGDLPLELEAILKEGSPQMPKVTPTSILVESGEQMPLISISEPVEQVSLLLNLDNRIFGKDYRSVSGFFRVTAQHDGAQGVSLRLVPEIHHGPVQRTYQALPALPGAVAYAPKALSIHDGQQEETLRNLTTTLVLDPSQVAIIGCRPEQQGALGSFLFTQAEAGSDQRRQKLILIWASRNLQGMSDGSSKATDRPKLFQRLVPPPPGPAVVKPAGSAPAKQRTNTSAPAAASDTNASGSPSPTTPKSEPPTDPDIAGKSGPAP